MAQTRDYRAHRRQLVDCAGEVEIRPPRLADGNAAAVLHHRNWATTYLPLVPPDQAGRLSLDERLRFWDWLIRMRPPKLGALIAVRSGKVVGLVQWEIEVDGDPTVGEIHSIHVAAGERGRGIGGRLLAAAVWTLRKRRLLRAILWVVETNAPARALYERRGWKWDGTRLERPLGGVDGLPTVIEVRYSLDLRTPASRACGEPNHP